MSRVRLYPDPILLMVAEPCHLLGEDAWALRTEMAEVMKEEGGIGIAAPQIGYSTRAILVSDAFMMNPRIVARSGIRVPTDERCLSVPGFSRRRYRSASVKVRYRDAGGAIHTEQFRGVEAACVQHELDHLDGRLIVHT